MNYQKIHDKIIARAKSENRKKIKNGIYYEQHHIIPRCMGGNNSKENLVLLTGREHFLIHLLLAKIFNTRELWFACQIMTMSNSTNSNRYKISSSLYELIKINLSEKQKNRTHSEETKLKMSNTRKGIKLSKETKKKISDSKKGLPLHENTRKACIKKNIGLKRTKKHKLAISLANKGKIMSEITKLKLSNAQKGEKNYNFGKKLPESTLLKLRGRKLSEETKNKMRGRKRTLESIKLQVQKMFKPVDKFTKEGIYIETYPSLKVAALENNILYNSISKVCNDSTNKKTAKGFKWKFKQ